MWEEIGVEKQEIEKIKEKICNLLDKIDDIKQLNIIYQIILGIKGN